MTEFVRDLLTKLRGERGSVMMEFIIVMPIYLVLFGATCAVGDLLVHSGRLLSADRFSAFFADEKSATEIKAWIEETMFPGEIGPDGKSLNNVRACPEYHYADTTAPWTVCVAADTEDSYGISAGGGVAQVLFGKQFFRRANGRPDNSQFWDQYEAEGRKVIFSRPGIGEGRYNHSYYVLKRKRSLGRTWRDAPGSLLMKQNYPGCVIGQSAWNTEVYQEGWFDEPDKFGDYGSKSATRRPYQDATDFWYSRYDQFVTWSR